MNCVQVFDQVNLIQVPRLVNYHKNSTLELHVFSDAFEKMYAGFIYLRTTGSITTNLLSSNTRLGPVKSIFLTRLELCGAVLASELLNSTLGDIEIPIDCVHCWPDSMNVLTWRR